MSTRRTPAGKTASAVSKRKTAPARRKPAAAAPGVVPIAVRVQLNDPDWPLRVEPFVAEVNDGEKTMEWTIETQGWQFDTTAIAIHPDGKSEFPDPVVHHKGRTKATLRNLNRRVSSFNYTIYLVHKKSGTRLSLDPGVSNTDHTSKN